ncbi:MAG: hypothetical protein PHU97_08370 [Bacteroidales bacterium]|nr:hypothetical protein [Bacteroidales bacterium]
MRFKQCLYKNEVADLLGISRSTLAHWLNEKYLDDLVKIGYRKKQKYLTPKQLTFLQEKVDLTAN